MIPSRCCNGCIQVCVRCATGVQACVRVCVCIETRKDDNNDEHEERKKKKPKVIRWKVVVRHNIADGSHDCMYVFAFGMIASLTWWNSVEMHMKHTRNIQRPNIIAFDFVVLCCVCNSNAFRSQWDDLTESKCQYTATATNWMSCDRSHEMFKIRTILCQIV